MITAQTKSDMLWTVDPMLMTITPTEEAADIEPDEASESNEDEEEEDEDIDDEDEDEDEALEEEEDEDDE